MLALLDEMDEENHEYDNKNYHQKQTKMNTAKDDFFKLFSQYFYCLWDLKNRLGAFSVAPSLFFVAFFVICERYSLYFL